MQAKRFALAIVLVVMGWTLLVAGCSQAEELTIDAVFSMAHAATSGVSSYRFDISGNTAAEGLEVSAPITGDGAFSGPDRFQRTFGVGDSRGSNIYIGDRHYRLSSPDSGWREVPMAAGAAQSGASYGGLAGPIDLDFLETLEEGIIQLEDEIVGGVKTWHYKFPTETADMVTPIQKQLDSETDPEERLVLQEMIDQLIAAPTTLEREIWIGQEDFLVRRIGMTQTISGLDVEFGNVELPAGTIVTTIIVYSYHSFNEPMTIEAPSDIAP